jgi:hypothetical protein
MRDLIGSSYCQSTIGLHAGEIKGNGHAEVVNREKLRGKSKKKEKLRGGHACKGMEGKLSIFSLHQLLPK